MMLTIAVISSALALTSIAIVFALLLTGSRERRELYDRIQAGTIRDYEQVQEFRQGREMAAQAAQAAKPKDPASEPWKDELPPAIDLSASQAIYNRMRSE
jgi:hypothetical protein